MSTKSTSENRHFKAGKSLQELKPLHRTWPFWTIVFLTAILPLLSAHLIYPLMYWNLSTLENGSELFKTSLVVGGACLSLLTIYSLAYRSLETNRQHQLSRMQFVAASRQTNIQLKIKLMEQSNLAIATTKRLKARLDQFNTLIHAAQRAVKDDPNKHIELNSAIKINITDSYRIYEDMLDRSPELLSSIPQEVQQDIDKNLYSTYEAVMIWPKDPSRITNNQLFNAKIDTKSLDEFEAEARKASEAARKLLEELVDGMVF